MKDFEDTFILCCLIDNKQKKGRQKILPSRIKITYMISSYFLPPLLFPLPAPVPVPVSPVEPGP
jgi:hypothetical protein